MSDPRASAPATARSIRLRLRHAGLDAWSAACAPTVGTTGVVLDRAPAMEPGTTVRFEILLADETSVLRGEGRVTSVRASASLAGAHAVGVRFTRLDARSKALLDQLSREGRIGAVPGLLANEPVTAPRAVAAPVVDAAPVAAPARAAAPVVAATATADTVEDRRTLVSSEWPAALVMSDARAAAPAPDPVHDAASERDEIATTRPQAVVRGAAVHEPVTSPRGLRAMREPSLFPPVLADAGGDVPLAFPRAPAIPAIGQSPRTMRAEKPVRPAVTALPGMLAPPTEPPATGDAPQAPSRPPRDVPAPLLPPRPRRPPPR